MGRDLSAQSPIFDSSPFADIIVATWYHVDVGDPGLVQNYFTPDATIFFSRADPIVGRQNIHDGYVARRANNSNRISRHVVSNVFVTSLGVDTAETACCMRLYAGEGSPPIPGPEPVSVADQYDRFVRGDDGAWLIAERRLRALFANPDTLFKGPVAPAVPSEPSS